MAMKSLRNVPEIKFESKSSMPLVEKKVRPTISKINSARLIEMAVDHELPETG
jgi:hypothetical protein